MKKVAFSIFMIFFGVQAIESYSQCSKKFIIKYEAQSEQYEVSYFCTFSGIEYINLYNYKKNYSIVCELTDRKKVIIRQYHKKGHNFDMYYSIIDTLGDYYSDFNGALFEKNKNENANRIKVSQIEINLLKAALQITPFENAKKYDYDLDKILFFINGRK